MMGLAIWILLSCALTLALVFIWTRKLTFLAQKPIDYLQNSPAFDIRRHLNGPILCEGMIYGPTGRVTSRFVADFDISWNGNVGRMKEKFHYCSGETQDREWELTVSNDGTIKAHADDVIGVGEGMQMGPAVQLKYRLKLPDSSGGHELDTVDWMYLIENGTIMNRSQFRKYGIKVAELVATMRPKEAA